MVEFVNPAKGLGLRRLIARHLARQAGRLTLNPAVPRGLARARMDKSGDRVPAAPGVLIEAGSVAGRPVLRFRPDQPRPGLIVFLHGGGYVLGSPQSHKPLVSRLSRLFAMEAVSVDYRLAPEHVCPAAIDDAEDALEALVAEASGPVLLAGDSAGGGLALAAAIRHVRAGRRPLAALYLLSPWTDLSMSGASVADRAVRDPMITPEALRGAAAHYLDGRDPRDPEASPLFADLSGLPPVFIQVGEDEVLLDDSIRLADRIGAAGGAASCEVWRGLFHDFQLFSPVLQESDSALERARAWLDPRL